MNRHIQCGINIDPANSGGGRPTVQEIQDIGATWVRLTFKDYSTDSAPSSYDLYDAVVHELGQAGISILMILDYETYPGMPGYGARDTTWKRYIAKLAQRSRQIAKHFGSRVQAYQIWNEPDLPQPGSSYDPRLRATVLGWMLESTFAAIKDVSSATVVTGGLASGQPGYIRQVRATTGDMLYADAVGLHPYGQRPTSNWPNASWGFGVLADLIQAYHEVVSKPIWITEIGTRDMAAQGDFPRRAFEALNGDLAAVSPYAFWFCWSDGMVHPFGLVDLEGKRKPAYRSFRRFASLPFVDVSNDGVVERLSTHSSERDGHDVKYIIVHSTASPVGVRAQNTLRYLVGPNRQQVSAHELVLPGGRVYRLVPDERAAHHVGSLTAEFPDGTAVELANQITWGIEAYQVRGKPVSGEVLQTTIRRVVAACRRFGLDESRVLGHREIDPHRRKDPVGVDMDALRAAVAKGLLRGRLLQEAEAHQVIRFNARAALQRRISADGFVPNSPEFDVQAGGITYRAQRAEHLRNGKVRVYYTEVGNWGNVRYVERP